MPPGRDEYVDIVRQLCWNDDRYPWHALEKGLPMLQSDWFRCCKKTSLLPESLHAAVRVLVWRLSPKIPDTAWLLSLERFLDVVSSSHATPPLEERG